MGEKLGIAEPELFPINPTPRVRVSKRSARRGGAQSIIAWPGVHMMVINLPKHLLV